MQGLKTYSVKETGDFQTPPELAARVVNRLSRLGIRWARFLEPNCGDGNFFKGLTDTFGDTVEIRGVELQPHHVARAREAISNAGARNAVVYTADLFRLDLRKDITWSGGGPLLVIGNPPWVTNSALGALNSTNVPVKNNARGLRGLDAVTGKSNFDTAEYVWQKLLGDLAPEKPSIALLCKLAVARKTLEYARAGNVPLKNAFIARIDGRKWFGIAADACLLYVEVGTPAALNEVPVFDDLDATRAGAGWGFVRDRLVADVKGYSDAAVIDGVCPLTWRQGLKHDAAAVMELTLGPNGVLTNGFGEEVNIERDFVFPLLKGTPLFKGETTHLHRFVIVPQRRLGEDTAALTFQAPLLWKYLSRYRAVLAHRKSSIYKTQPPFAVFGVGDYTFTNYKVAISGLHRDPRFMALRPHENRPILLDDTCYFVACRSAPQAALIAALLSDELTTRFIKALAFPDNKRLVTKSLLQRIDLNAVFEQANPGRLQARVRTELTRLGEPEPLPSLAPGSVPSDYLRDYAGNRDELSLFSR